MGRPHLLVIPYPAQGHVMPLMELSHNLVERGFKITFVNSDFNHKRVMDAMSVNGGCDDRIQLVSLPDGVESEEDRNNLQKLTQNMAEVMPKPFEKLITGINESNNGDDRITCVIADLNQSWALKVTKKMSIPLAAFWPASTTLLASVLHIPKLIEEGIIDADGIPIRNQMIQLSPTMPAMNTANLFWLQIGDLAMQKSVFKIIFSNYNTLNLPEYVLCNSFHELEPSVFTLLPHVKPIGPLSTSSRLAHFWPEDSTCLSWLDQQPLKSVIYVAFGSHAVLDKQQFDELALGLELCGQSFLWVVRADITEEVGYPEGFEARVGSRGRMVGWAPQREVLAHPSIGCFLTHCGWNSTIEGISVGVPLLCWPYFADQILNASFICDVWKVGLGLSMGGNGMIERAEIKSKVSRIFGDEVIKENATKYKQMAMDSISNGGASLKNFDEFVEGFLGMFC